MANVSAADFAKRLYEGMNMNTAFACSQCGERVVVEHALEYRLMMQGSKRPLCPSCTNLRPIETSYNGYHFRSRLEARWAIFFDALSLSYEYEPEGFDLGKLGWYLPDFRIDGSIWLEVKSKNGCTDRSNTLMGALAAESGQLGIIVYGDPFEHIAVIYHREPSIQSGYRRELGNFMRLNGAIEASLKARQARFEHGAQP